MAAEISKSPLPGMEAGSRGLLNQCRQNDFRSASESVAAAAAQKNQNPQTAVTAAAVISKNRAVAAAA